MSKSWQSEGMEAGWDHSTVASETGDASGSLVRRPRRLRRTESIRRLVREVRLHPSQFVLPLFVTGGRGVRMPVGSMPGVFRCSVDEMLRDAEQAQVAGVGGVILFGIPGSRDATGSAAWDDSGPVPNAIRALGREFPKLVVIADVCMCEYTDHGHCGLLSSSGTVDNDATLELLARAATCYAASGADMVAPSDMMDGRVRHIRGALDSSGLHDAAILSYAVKHASSFYGPFREAAGSTPSFGDRRGYQMDPANAREAVLEARLDVAEGADIVMVKPAGTCLDIIAGVRAAVDVPVAAYQVSGEYSMIHAAAANGWIDRDAAMMESLVAIARAGAGIVVTYFAREAAGVLRRDWGGG